MPGLWRLVAAPGTSPGGQAYGHAGTAMQNCVTNESSLTQYREKRKISDAPDEAAMTHRAGVATESMGCGWANLKSSDLPHSALRLRPGCMTALGLLAEWRFRVASCRSRRLHCTGQIRCKQLVKSNANDWSAAVQTSGQVECNCPTASKKIYGHLKSTINLSKGR